MAISAGGCLPGGLSSRGRGVSARGCLPREDVWRWVPARRVCLPGEHVSARGCVCQRGCIGKGVCLPGRVCLPWSVSTSEVCLPGCVCARHTPSEQITDRCKNFTLPQLRLRIVKIKAGNRKLTISDV